MGPGSFLTRRGAMAGMFAGAVPVGPPGRKVLVELFTSQGCSSCPPADALLRELARERADILALAFHVTYWDRLGWRDPFALAAATARQKHYAAITDIGSVYTPQMVVDGVHDVVGSDRRRVLATLARAAATARAALTLELRREAGRIVVVLGAGAGQGRVLLVGYDAERTTPVARGENAGRTMVEANIVRALVELGPWSGAAITLGAVLPAGERHAVIVQGADGTILGVA